MRIKTLAAIGIISLGVASPIQSRTAQEAIDDLIVCTVVYGRISEIYRDRGDSEQGSSFTSTAQAYGVSANYLIDQNLSGEGLDTYLEDRMASIIVSLNKSAEQKSDGDLGVIAEWLDYCDTLGPGVQQILEITG